MAADVWDPGQYGRFAAERSLAFFDLVALLKPVPGGRVVDLGCGPGELTALLPSLLGAGEVLGIDSSTAMLEEAAAHRGPGVTFRLGDLATWEDPAAWDVVFANASLHWAPDHPAVLARWAASLGEHGQLAVQVPANADHPSHLVAAEVAAEEPFASVFVGGSPPPDVVSENVLAPEAYAVVLHDLGFTKQTVRLQVYGHLLGSTADVVESGARQHAHPLPARAATGPVRRAGPPLPRAAARTPRRLVAVLLPVQADPARRAAVRGAEGTEAADLGSRLRPLQGHKGPSRGTTWTTAGSPIAYRARCSATTRGRTPARCSPIR